MSCVLFVEPISFTNNTSVKNPLVQPDTHISVAKSEQDHVQAIAEFNEVQDAVRKAGVNCVGLRLTHESPSTRYQFLEKGLSIFPSHSISFHNFTNREGKVTRRVAILYPMNPCRQGELPASQVVHKLLKAADEGCKIQVVDLRYFQDQGKYLEGTGALNFSHDGKFVYMSRSCSTDDDVLDVVCSPQNLNIPPENRFVFSTSLPSLDRDGNINKKKEFLAHHTSIAGWCGRGICAWPLDYMCFDSEEEYERFMNHIHSEYKSVLNLNPREVINFAGNAIELAATGSQGVSRTFFISKSGFDALQQSNRRAIQDVYGDNIAVIYLPVLERRSGTSIRALIAASITHGCTLPSCDECTACKSACIKERVA